MIKKIINSLRKHIIVTFTLIITVIIILPFLILTPTDYGIFEKSDAQAIVSYLGAIIGGALTLVGVRWTINDQNKNKLLDNKRYEKEKQESLRIQYRPILTVSNEIGRPILLDNSIMCNLKIENKGRGESKNIQISIKSDDCITIIKDISKSFLTPEDSLIIEFYITKKLLENNSEKINESDKFTCKLVFEFDDLVDNHYIQTFTCIIENVLILPPNIKKVEDIMNTKTKAWLYKISHISMPILKEKAPDINDRIAEN